MRKRCLLLLVLLPFGSGAADVDALVGQLLGDTPVVDDLRELTDQIGGRPTGSDANRKAVEWAVATLRAAEVDVVTEDFRMPRAWEEIEASARIDGDLQFDTRVIAKPFSSDASIKAPVVDGGDGGESALSRVAEKARDAWLLVETPVLDDQVGLAGLFAEVAATAAIEERAFDLGVAGIVFMSSRPKNLVYRLNASRTHRNDKPLLIMEREHAQRIIRLLRDGHSLSLDVRIETRGGDPYTATNVIAEIPGSKRPQEIVLFGAHLDSHDLGTGALDNGVNVAMLINIARQITRLGIEPERTIRLVLWNGEEQGLVGSWRYTEQHEDELDDHIVAGSFDIGSGRTVGFFTGGRPELVALVNEYLAPVSGLGPFQQVDVPVVGTDNFDFMMQGIPNLVALQDDANYASNYHAESDTFDKVDQYQLRLNSAIAAAVILGFANDSRRLPRQSRAEIESLIENTDLEQQMRNFGVWPDWENGDRGRRD